MNKELKPLIEEYIVRVISWHRGDRDELRLIENLLDKMDLLLNKEIQEVEGLFNILSYAGIQNHIVPEVWFYGFEGEDIELVVIEIMSCINI